MHQFDDIIETLSDKIETDRLNSKKKKSTCRYEALHHQLSDPQTWESILRAFLWHHLLMGHYCQTDRTTSINTPILEIKKRIGDVQLKFNAIFNAEDEH